MKSNIKRLRVFAGPNGSGKTTLVESLIANGRFKAKSFINADLIEKTLKEEGFFDISTFSFKSNTEEIQDFIEEKGMIVSKLKDDRVIKNVLILEDRIYVKDTINSYYAADIASFLRKKMFEHGESFWFETVFSHESKLELMKKAKALGYKVYLYFITTDDVEINISRVKSRVLKGGHDVAEIKIRERYVRSLDFLYEGIKISDKSFLFDNSTQLSRLICSVEDSKVSIEIEKEKLPNWFIQYIINKKYSH